MFATLLMTLAPVVQDAAQSPPVLSIQEIKFQEYVPRHAHPQELYETARELIGRSFYVRERGGIHARHVDNLSLLGDAVLVYDEEAYAVHVLNLLKGLDNAPDRALSPEPPELTTYELRPRFVSMDTVLKVLQPFWRELRVRASDGSMVVIDNLAVSGDHGVLLVRDYAEEVAQIRGVVERVDVPAPQVTITCRMIRAQTEGPGGDLPADLVQGLEQLLPGRSFRAYAFATLRVGVRPGASVSLRLEDDHGDYVLRFEPAAYDARSGELAVRGCTLSRNDQLLFTTDTSFRGGEHTVVGATGTQPTFLVVHVGVP